MTAQARDDESQDTATIPGPPVLAAEAALADLRAKVEAVIAECDDADSPLSDDVEAELSLAFGDDTYDEVRDAKRDAARKICAHFAAALAAVDGSSGSAVTD